MPVRDLTGQQFGRLTVLERDFSKIGAAAYWICQCSCGTIKSIRGSNLTATTRPTLSCGCLNKEKTTQIKNITSLIGKRFGRLTVLERDLNKPKGKGYPSYWICQCDCGNKCSIDYSSLQNGHTQSCGCLRKELLSQKNIKDITNQRFGMVVAKERLNMKSHQSWIWRCECDCGNKNYLCSTENLLSGKIISCGCSKKSRGEFRIEEILKFNNISYIREFSFKDLKDISYLRFDFALINNDKIIRLIEFDGEQHFHNRKNSLWNKNGTEFAILQKHDKMKNDYCKEHNIPLVRIPYTEVNNITLEILLGEEFLII